MTRDPRTAGTMVNCSYCRTPLDPEHPNTYRRVHAWERRSLSVSRRSASDVVLRERQQEFACSECVRRLKAGLPVMQEELAV